MKLLAIDTATERCSAALWIDGDVRERSALQPREHARLILPMIDELLAEAGLRLEGLDAIAYGRGPGAFTGVRLAVSVTQGLAMGAGLPVVGVSDLAALAHAGHASRGWPRLLACLDARMGEVYRGAYRIDGQGLATAEGEEALADPAAVQCPPGWAGVGHGWPLVLAAGAPAPAELDSAMLPRAVDVAWLGSTALRSGQTVAAEQAAPVYLRDRVAERPSPRCNK